MNNLIIDKQTIQKFDVPGPRYTSYPTAPEWTTDVTADIYRQKLAAFGRSDKTLSLYIHIPFCQSMCTYCACNVVIRKKEDKVGDEYLEYLFKEIDLVRNAIGKKKKVRQFHWGGGTPTYLNEDQIEKLFKKVRANFDVDLKEEVAIEIDPRTIDESKLRKLKKVGFNRISLGVQDFNGDVQKKVNRIQPFELVKKYTDLCRELKFHSLNFDLIYGLPGQTKKSIQETIEKVILLKPDRIALYSFAYVPWLKKHQNKIHKDDLPSSDQKLEIFLLARELLLSNGYQAIAMDHFALETDELAIAFNKGTLHRNFMGYTVKPADEYVGLGLSAIGFLESTFIHNYKTINEYYRLLKESTLPVEEGKSLTHDDQIRQWVIHSLMCRFQIDKNEFYRNYEQGFDNYFEFEQPHIQKCLKDGLIASSDNKIAATDLGKLFIRNVCMGFDWYLRQQKEQKRFSRTV